MTGPLPDAAAGAGAAAHLAGALRRGSALPQVGQLEPGGKRRAEVVVVRRHERRDDDGPLGGDRLDVLEGHVADQLGLGEVAGGGEPHAELPGGPAGELLHPAHAEPQRLAEDAVVVARCRASVAEVHRGRLRGQLGRRRHPRRR